MSAGHSIFGGALSLITDTVNEAAVRSPQSVIAMQFTTVVPSGKNLPDGGSQVTVDDRRHSVTTRGAG
jgi:hypothetical protein